MADVVLATALLVRDDGEAVGLRSGPRGRRDRDDRATGCEVGAVVFELPERSVVDGLEIDGLRVAQRYS